KGTEGLLHISEIEWARLDKVPYSEGDEVEVKFMGYDDRKKMKLSRKVLLTRPPRPERKEGEGDNRENRGPRNDRRDDRRDGGDRRPGGNNRGGNDRPQHSGRQNERPAGEDTFKPLNEGENTDDVKPEGF
ncbi:S1 RNA-binding domain-containing protein, partial [Kaistella sp.]|uniref:S1 RNA-binding domain-containing protein n=1 Tax=Kaistella sp. TaxID=2782235 RepID=UPI002F923F1B